MCFMTDGRTDGEIGDQLRPEGQHPSRRSRNRPCIRPHHQPQLEASARHHSFSAQCKYVSVLTKSFAAMSATHSSSDETVVLYTYFRSGASWRVRIALNLKGIAYTPKFVNLLKAEQRTDEYADTVNPSRLLPALIIDGHLLNQSLAILEYLQETRPNVGPALLPPATQPEKRALVRSLCHIIASDTQPIQNLRVLQKVSDDHAARADWAKHWITLGLQAYEKAIAKCAGKYSVGDEVTMADVCLVPQIYNANRFGVDLAPFPLINRVVAELNKLEAFDKAKPENQDDNPEKQKQ
ncbi:glutathione S-transferase [Catenaria anguillulae PL171]|uniref:Glutathione S-transferase n=1 Tax=Catenaria anguillulae PL171 TaxID=765915 RepID=A0A1Y2HBW4_9FUNG|nr:glutathione S-transferase [Catenaria anguillulae PL171]